MVPLTLVIMLMFYIQKQIKDLGFWKEYFILSKMKIVRERYF